jgi:hypothetical protein
MQPQEPNLKEKERVSVGTDFRSVARLEKRTHQGHQELSHESYNKAIAWFGDKFVSSETS